eukprot:723229-Rhodomonas_salina.4
MSSLHANWTCNSVPPMEYRGNLSISPCKWIGNKAPSRAICIQLGGGSILSPRPAHPELRARTVRHVPPTQPGLGSECVTANRKGDKTPQPETRHQSSMPRVPHEGVGRVSGGISRMRAGCGLTSLVSLQEYTRMGLMMT